MIRVWEPLIDWRRKVLYPCVAFVLIAALVLVFAHFGFPLHWLAVHTGTVNETGPYYGFWSGFGSDLGEVALIGAVAGIYHKHNCHQKGCWRIAKFEVDGTPYKVCRKHHPTIPDKAVDGEIADAHAIAQEARK